MAGMNQALRSRLLDFDLESMLVLDHILSTVAEHIDASALYFVHDKPCDGLPPFIRATAEFDDARAKEALVALLGSENGLGPIDQLQRCRPANGSPLAAFCEQVGAQEAMVIPIPGAKPGEWFFAATRPKKGKYWRSGLDVHKNADVVRLLIEIAQKQEAEQLRIQLETRSSGAKDGSDNFYSAILDNIHGALGIERILMLSYEKRERCFLLEASSGISARKTPYTFLLEDNPLLDTLLTGEEEWQIGAHAQEENGITPVLAVQIENRQFGLATDRFFNVILLFLERGSTALWGESSIRAIIAAVRSLLSQGFRARDARVSSTLEEIAAIECTNSLQQDLHKALDTTLNLIPAERGRILLFDEIGDLQTIATIPTGETSAQVEGGWGSLAEDAVAQAQSDQDTYIGHFPKGARLCTLLSGADSRSRAKDSAITIPLIDTWKEPTRLLGILQLVGRLKGDHDRPYLWFFGDTDKGVLERISRVLSGQIARFRLDEELVRALQQLDSATEVANERRTALNNWLSVLHHQLLSPIEPVIHRMEYFRSLLKHKGMLNEHIEHCISDILGEMEGLTFTIEGANLLASAEPDLHLEHGNLVRDVIHPVLHMLIRKARARGIRLDLIPRISLPDMGFDRQYAKQVVHNLLLNAIKYAHHGSTINVITDRDDYGPVLRVQNWGIGVPSGWEETIFDRGVSAPNAEAIKVTGAGLGLFIVRRIVESHGWQIRLASNADPTEFVIGFQGGQE